MTKTPLWLMLHHGRVSWHKADGVREHLRNAKEPLAIEAYFDWRAGPIYCDEKCSESRTEDRPWIAMEIIRKRGRELPADNDNDWDAWNYALQEQVLRAVEAKEAWCTSQQSEDSD